MNEVAHSISLNIVRFYIRHNLISYSLGVSKFNNLILILLQQTVRKYETKLNWEL